MSTGISSERSGCTLPEEERLYYLDAMGIRTWQALEPVSGAAGQPAPVQPESALPSGGIGSGAAGPGEMDARSRPDNAVVWATLEQDVASCTKCGLHAGRTQTVFGVGSHSAQLMIIGEAPGQEEDRQGEPFVGRAGQLLNAMLNAIHLKREQVYIANIVKCRPPSNRNPEPEEIACCNPWLNQQIELLQPRAIFAIGRIAAHTLLDTDAAIGALRERRHDYAGVPVIVGYHPAYLLRRPIEKRKAWQDLRRVQALLEEL